VRIHCSPFPRLAHSLVSLLSIRFISLSFNHPATSEIYTLSLHDALPISASSPRLRSLGITSARSRATRRARSPSTSTGSIRSARSEEHTSELQSPDHLVCRLLLEKKKKKKRTQTL